MMLPLLTTSGSRWGRHSPRPVIAGGTLGALPLPTCKQQHANNSLASADAAGGSPGLTAICNAARFVFSPPHLPGSSGALLPETPPGAISWKRLMGPPSCCVTLILSLAVTTSKCVSRCFLPRDGTMGLGSLGCPLSQRTWLQEWSKHPLFSKSYKVYKRISQNSY